MNVGRWASVLVIASALHLAEGARASAGVCHAVRVSAADPTGERSGRRGPASVLSASEAKDLKIEVWLSDAASGRPVQVKLFTPRGRPYQVLDAIADQNPPAEREGRRRGRRHGDIRVARFPVAGTHITTHALYGEWRVEVYVDGGETACTRPLRFTIEP